MHHIIRTFGIGSATALLLTLWAAPAGAAWIELDRTPVPPSAIVNDGTGVALYDWTITADTTPDHYIEFLLGPDDDMLACTFHDLIGWNQPLPPQWASCAYVDESASWPQPSPIVGANTWTAPAGATPGRYELRVRYHSIEVGDLWEAEAAVVFWVAEALGALEVLVWHDVDGDAERDAGEEGLPIWLVTADGPLGNDFSARTGPAGLVFQDGLPIGPYAVSIMNKPGWIPTTPILQGTTVETGQVAYLEFGVRLTGSIGDRVWWDIDADGVQGADEDGIEGVTVRLLDAAGEVLDEAITDADGGYLFAGLDAGDYVVEIDGATLPAQVTLTTPPEPRPVALAYATDHLDADFGYTPCGAEVCNGEDDDCDGEIDEDFPGLGEACDGDDLDACETGTWACAPDGASVECVGEGASKHELCNGLDDDCDGEIDENFPLLGELCDDDDADLCAYGTMACFPQELCRDPAGCGPYLCVEDDPSNMEEVCNGEDDDCDGEIDEDLGGVLSCGVGACYTEVPACEDGALQECVPLPPQPENCCNDIDDDCDGLVNEDCYEGPGWCGDGIVQPWEACDDGPFNSDEAGKCQTWCAKSEIWPPEGQIIVAWEDLPMGGGNDWDYNDWVIELETEFVFDACGLYQLRIYVDPWARGAGYVHSQTMRLLVDTLGVGGEYIFIDYDKWWGYVSISDPIPFAPGEDVEVTFFEDTWETLPPNHYGDDYGVFAFDANTEAGYGVVHGAKVGVQFSFDSPGTLTPEALAAIPPGLHGETTPFGMELEVWNTGQVIGNGDPRMLVIPAWWDWPQETVAIWEVYDGVTPADPPQFSADWYLNPAGDGVWYAW